MRAVQRGRPTRRCRSRPAPGCASRGRVDVPRSVATRSRSGDSSGTVAAAPDGRGQRQPRDPELGGGRRPRRAASPGGSAPRCRWTPRPARRRAARPTCRPIEVRTSRSPIRTVGPKPQAAGTRSVPVEAAALAVGLPRTSSLMPTGRTIARTRRTRVVGEHRRRAVTVSGCATCAWRGNRRYPRSSLNDRDACADPPSPSPRAGARQPSPADSRIRSQDTVVGRGRVTVSVGLGSRGAASHAVDGSWSIAACGRATASGTQTLDADRERRGPAVRAAVQRDAPRGSTLSTGSTAKPRRRDDAVERGVLLAEPRQRRQAADGLLDRRRRRAAPVRDRQRERPRRSASPVRGARARRGATPRQESSDYPGRVAAAERGAADASDAGVRLARSPVAGSTPATGSATSRLDVPSPW